MSPAFDASYRFNRAGNNYHPLLTTQSGSFLGDEPLCVSSYAPDASPKAHWAGNRYRKVHRHKLSTREAAEAAAEDRRRPDIAVQAGCGGVLLLAGGVLARKLTK